MGVKQEHLTINQENNRSYKSKDAYKSNNLFYSAGDSLWKIFGQRQQL